MPSILQELMANMGAPPRPVSAAALLAASKLCDVVREVDPERDCTVDDAIGEAVLKFVNDVRCGHKGKMANGKDPFLLAANQMGKRIGAKQLRRHYVRKQTILAFEEAGLEPPRLPITFYSLVFPLANLRLKHEALRMAADKNWSVSELKKHILQLRKSDLRAKVSQDSRVKALTRRIGQLISEADVASLNSIRDSLETAIADVDARIKKNKDEVEG